MSDTMPDLVLTGGPTLATALVATNLEAVIAAAVNVGAAREYASSGGELPPDAAERLAALDAVLFAAIQAWAVDYGDSETWAGVCGDCGHEWVFGVTGPGSADPCPKCGGLE
jgi:hypothetical protein